MLYDSLLLNHGGGIISESNKAEQFQGSAALAIGLGGTGIAALSALKGKIHQQLRADNPDEPIPRYEGIQLLGIDTDMGDYKKYRGNCRLRKDEFLSICNPQLSTALRSKQQIKSDPLFDWMDIDHIDRMLSPCSWGGIRQVGRYLLMSKIDELETKIQSKCRAAMKHRASQSLDIYIFAGISGGTGSGCFLDTCYIVRQIAENNGWNAKIMGYFFLPDVVTSKPQVAHDTAAREYNEANGYAALKELDYLMSLRDAHDYFTQDYSPTLRVHTQEPPVDMCHLVSASRADGTLVPNGFTYAINVATDYVMTYLADLDPMAEDSEDSAFSLRSEFIQTFRHTEALSRTHGANLSYHIIGGCAAEIPTSQINTYLACGFYAKFMKAISGERSVVTKSSVAGIANELGLTADLVRRSVVDKSPGLMLPEIGRRLLVQSPKPAKGYLNDEWAKFGNDWLDRCDGQMVANCNRLTGSLDTYDPNYANVQSLIGRVFRKLLDLSIDPNYGPYFTAQILHNGRYDLTTEIDGHIKTADERVRTQEMYLQDAEKNLEGAKDGFFDTRNPNRNSYSAYENAAGKWFLNVNAIQQERKTSEVLQQFKKQLMELYNGYFKPLCNMLDNLRETFVENQTYLSMPNATADNAYTRQILTFQDIQQRLDARIESLAHLEFEEFIINLLNNSESWINSDPEKISFLIREHMLTLFQDETDRSMQDYLFEKYPQAQNDRNSLADEIEKDIMERIHKSAEPTFWLDPSFSLDNTIQSGSLRVPGGASAVCAAADSFKTHYSNFKYTIRKTGIGDRIFALRRYSGIPLYAYQGIVLLKGSYDKAENCAAGVGNHLYAATGRGEPGGSGHKDWRHFLPTPVPYSRNPKLISEGEKLLKLYEEGEAAGIISRNYNFEYVIHKTPHFEPKAYSLDDFMDAGRFNVPAYEAELERMQHMIATRYEDCQQIPLKNDGSSYYSSDMVDIPDRCRKDYFISFPMLQMVVREELKKLSEMQATIASLQAVKNAFNAYEADMNRFCNLIFCRGLICQNTMELEDHNKIAVIFCNYVDEYQDTRTFKFLDRNDDMPYGRNYPLYQAFLTYRSLDPKQAPRKELDEIAYTFESRSKKLKDLCIAYDLEQLWTPEAMSNLKEEVSHVNPKEAYAIIRFYEGLCNRIRDLKDDQPVWLSAYDREKIKHGHSDIKVPTPDYWQLWDPETQKYLVAYPQYGPTQAYDHSTNAWVAVRADMSLWNGTAWVPLNSDPFFANI